MFYEYRFENLLRETYLHCTFNRNGQCYFRCPEDIVPVVFSIPGSTCVKENNINARDVELYEDCFKFEDILKDANDKAQFKAEAAERILKASNIKPFDIRNIIKKEWEEAIMEQEASQVQIIHKQLPKFKKSTNVYKKNKLFITRKKTDLSKTNIIKGRTESVKVKKDENTEKPELFYNELTSTKKQTKHSTTTKNYGLLIRSAKNDNLPEIKNLNENTDKKTGNRLSMIGVKYIQPQREKKVKKSVQRIAPIKIVTRINYSHNHDKNGLNEKKPTHEELFNPS